VDPIFVFFSGSGFGSGFSINFLFGSGLFMKKTLESTLFFLKAQRILHTFELQVIETSQRSKNLHIFTALYL
jgi:hypothetical protein